MAMWSLWLQGDSKGCEGEFPWPAAGADLQAGKLCWKEEDGGAPCCQVGLRAASVVRGTITSLAGLLHVPIQVGVLGLETCSHKILTWQRGFESPDFASALSSAEDQDQGSGSSSPAWAVGPILPGK